MKKILFLFVILGFSILLVGQQKEIPLLKYEQLQKKIQTEGAEFLVVNFWSTTCAPCVKELPDFMKVNEEFQNNPKFKMLLVSLDRAKDLDRVRKFIRDKNITAEVVLLDDIKRMNTWIPAFDKSWSGEIPVTIFYQHQEKVLFHNGEMSLSELQDVVTQHLN